MRLGAKAMINQHNASGTVTIKILVFLPNLFAKKPAGTAPINAPSGTIDPIQEASVLVTLKFPSFQNNGRASDDHDR